MNFAKALAPIALFALSTPTPVLAAKEAKVPRCNGQSKRPANPYGTILPTLPARSPSGSAAQPTQLFPSSAAPDANGPASRNDSGVPPISAASPLPANNAATQPVYASC
jgi:hypothetical protein